MIFSRLPKAMISRIAIAATNPVISARLQQSVFPAIKPIIKTHGSQITLNSLQLVISVILLLLDGDQPILKITMIYIFPFTAAITEVSTIPGNFSQFSCIDCHEHNNQAELADDHRGINGYRFQSSACYGCHPDGED